MVVERIGTVGAEWTLVKLSILQISSCNKRSQFHVLSPVEVTLL